MTEGQTRRWPVAVEVVVGLAIAAAILGTAEGALRIAGFSRMMIGPVVSNFPGVNRPHPLWFWEPRPGDDLPDCAGERINSAGYRGPLRSEEKAPGSKRVVTLGDSSTFGVRVCQDETYPARLERELGGPEVLNFGVIGFTAFQGAQLLEGRVLAYHPDVVVLAFGAFNEARPAVTMDVDTRYAVTSQLNAIVVRWRDRLRDLRLLQLVQTTLASPVDPAEIERVKQAVDDVAKHQRADFVPNQTAESFERSLQQMVERSRAAGAEVVLVSPPRNASNEASWPVFDKYDRAIRRVSEDMGVPLVDVRSAFRAVPDGDKTLLLDGVHPSPAGHRYYAQLLAAKIRPLLGAAAPARRPEPADDAQKTL